MADDAKQEAVESSPTAVAVEEAAPDTSIPVEDLTSSQREKWLETGKLPKQDAEEENSQAPAEVEESQETKTEESSPSTESAEEVAESAPAKTQEKAEIPPHEARIKELWAKNKILEQRLADLERKPAKIETPVEEKAPNPEDYETMGQYLEAKVSFEVSRGVKKAQAERDAAETKNRIEIENQQIIKQWEERVAEAQKKHKDFTEKVFDGEFRVTQNSPLDRWALKSKFGTDVLYHFATHPEEFAKFNQIADSTEALDEIIVSLNSKILEKPKPAPKLVSSAPKPPAEVSGRGTATDDPSAEALASGDMEKYMRLENAKERAQHSSRK